MKYPLLSSSMPSTIAKGKICYIEMPAADIGRSADFYRRMFGWRIRQRDDGHVAFDDTTGQVSGTWVTGRAPAEPGYLFYILVDDAAETIKEIIANGGEIVQPIGADAPEITARFRDPGGNIVGLYQEPSGRP